MNIKNKKRAWIRRVIALIGTVLVLITAMILPISATEENTFNPKDLDFVTLDMSSDYTGDRDFAEHLPVDSSVTITGKYSSDKLQKISVNVSANENGPDPSVAKEFYDLEFVLEYTFYTSGDEYIQDFHLTFYLDNVQFYSILKIVTYPDLASFNDPDFKPEIVRKSYYVTGFDVEEPIQTAYDWSDSRKPLTIEASMDVSSLKSLNVQTSDSLDNKRGVDFVALMHQMFSIATITPAPTYTESYIFGYETGWGDGYAEGYDEGYEEGHVTGEMTGYDEGWEVGNYVGYNQGYEDGDSAGYDRGHAQGYEDARIPFYNAGYNDGYDEGEAAGTAATNDKWNELTENGTVPLVGGSVGYIWRQIKDAFTPLWEYDIPIININVGSIFVTAFTILIIGLIAAIYKWVKSS